MATPSHPGVDVTREQRIEYLRRQGVPMGIAAPPLFRMAWAVGVRVAPPHYASFWATFALAGAWFGGAMGAICALFSLGVGVPAGVPLAVAGLSGPVFGAAIASYYHGRRRALGLLPPVEVGGGGRAFPVGLSVVLGLTAITAGLVGVGLWQMFDGGRGSTSGMLVTVIGVGAAVYTAAMGAALRGLVGEELSVRPALRRAFGLAGMAGGVLILGVGAVAVAHTVAHLDEMLRGGRNGRMVYGLVMIVVVGCSLTAGGYRLFRGERRGSAARPRQSRPAPAGRPFAKCPRCNTLDARRTVCGDCGFRVA